MKKGMCIAVAIAVSPAKGSHGQLDRHAVALEAVSNKTRRNKITTNAEIPIHTAPI
jgi:hypothetical protein